MVMISITRLTWSDVAVTNVCFNKASVEFFNLKWPLTFCLICLVPVFFVLPSALSLPVYQNKLYFLNRTLLWCVWTVINSCVVIAYNKECVTGTNNTLLKSSSCPCPVVRPFAWNVEVSLEQFRQKLDDNRGERSCVSPSSSHSLCTVKRRAQRNREAWLITFFF